MSASLLGEQLEKRRDQLRTTLPIRRVVGPYVGPADVAALAVHIMTNTAPTGAMYDIDGGQQLVPGQLVKRIWFDRNLGGTDTNSLHTYSDRSASLTSTRAARSAGNIDAMIAAASSTLTETARGNAVGICRSGK